MVREALILLYILFSELLVINEESLVVCGTRTKQ